MPTSQPKTKDPRRFLAVLTVRNEGAFLLEWLAHHQAVGFTDFLIFSNDCDDESDALLDLLQELGVITHVRNDGPHENSVQWSALKLADKHPLVRDADWIMTLDIDEFVNIHVGNHTLPALLDALPDATAITLTWRLFGNDDVVRFHDRRIIDQFRRAAPRIMNWSWRASMFKTLFANDGIYGKLGVHRPRSPDKSRLDQARWFDGCGRELGERYKRQQVFSPFGQDNTALVQLNHYALGAMESYILKRDRGRPNRDDTAHGMTYWVDRNWCIEQDSSIDALKSERDAAFAKLIQEPRLRTKHGWSAGWRKVRFCELLKDEANRALFGRLLTTPPSQPMSSGHAKFLTMFAKPSPDRAN